MPDKTTTLGTNLRKAPIFLARHRQSKPIIGVPRISYGLEKVSYLIPTLQRDYVLSRTLSFSHFRGGFFYSQTPLIISGGLDLIHSFNQIPRNGRFVVSAELELPRFFGASEQQYKYGLDRLSSEDCLGIFTLSEATSKYLRGFFAERGYSNLLSKISVFRGGLHGGGPVIQQAQRDSPLKLLFVGTDGLRKGLAPLIFAFERLRQRDLEVQLTVVGGMPTTTYVAPGWVRRDFEWPGEYLSDGSLTVLASAPNEKVRALMQEADLLVFPTFDESLGWVPLEAGMVGTPTIATDIFALPEFIRPGETGWLLRLPKRQDGRWKHLALADGGAEFKKAELDLTDQLEALLAQLVDQREEVARRGFNARALAEGTYGFEVADRKLTSLYRQALEGGKYEDG